MKERPILMSAPMVLAILNGPKTQTRRTIKPQPSELPNGGFQWIGSDTNWFSNMPLDTMLNHCPYGQSGDRLWVKETFAPRADCPPGTAQAKHYCMYRASGGDPRDTNNWHDYGGKWKPSIFMPRWASRITLEITGVRVERVQEISEKDAKSEGPQPLCEYIGKCNSSRCASTHFRRSYVRLWYDINGPDSWASNPYVWVISFKRVS